MATREQAQRPLRDLLKRLPKLPLTPTQDIDFEGADAELLVAIADDAETTVSVLHHGVGAIGHLLSQAAVAIEDGTVSADCIESLGFLIAELGDLGAGCLTLATQCRRGVHDNQQPQLL